MTGDLFAPDLTPLQMLRAGVFRGEYFGGDMAEYPPEWAEAARARPWLGVRHNAFGVASGQSRAAWAAAGWLREQDPLGWFQWYCRWWLGRRSPDDPRQIARQRAFHRHSAQVRLHGGGDLTRRRAQRQSLLQWAYDPYPDRAEAPEDIFSIIFPIPVFSEILRDN